MAPWTKRRRSRRRRAGMGVLAAASFLAEATAIARVGYRDPRHVVVRCRAGHLFTTIWLPGASVKALRLGPWRVQRCPVGRHWSVVTPVRQGDLTADQLRAAETARDVRVP